MGSQTVSTMFHVALGLCDLRISKQMGIFETALSLRDTRIILRCLFYTKRLHGLRDVLNVLRLYQ